MGKPNSTVETNNPSRVHGSIAQRLAIAIVGGEYQPGDLLPPEGDFSTELAVSRTAYREAIRVLASKGLVESRPRAGTSIRPRQSWNMLDPDVLAWHFEVAPNPDYVSQLYQLRRIFEPNAAALAAENRSYADIDILHDAVTTMGDRTVDWEVNRKADLTFHHAVLVATGNEPLLSMSSTIGATVRWSTNKTLVDESVYFFAAVPDHWAVFEAIARRDPAAARAAMEVLVDRSLANFKHLS